MEHFNPLSYQEAYDKLLYFGYSEEEAKKELGRAKSLLQNCDTWLGAEHIRSVLYAYVVYLNTKS